MSRYTFQKSIGSKQRLAIAATLGIAIVSTGIFSSISSNAQNSTPGTTPIPTTPIPTTTPTTPVTKPSNGGSMGKPDATTTPDGGMSKPSQMPATTPDGGMSKPSQMPATTPDGGMSKPSQMPATTPDGGMSKPSQMPVTTTPVGKTIVDIAAGNKSFTTLVKAIKAADLVETLAGEGPFTVFAPTDEAFAKLPKGTLTKLLKPENKEQLKKILTYHVVPGAVTSKMLKAGKVDTVEGSQITVKITAKKVMINNANVIKANIKTSNGVIHAIDRVIMPPTN
jgi:uncharacterized surface protein with fasciclin (FAS1) repeats